MITTYTIKSFDSRSFYQNQDEIEITHDNYDDNIEIKVKNISGTIKVKKEDLENVLRKIVA